MLNDFVAVNHLTSGSAVPCRRWRWAVVACRRWWWTVVACILKALCSQFHGFCYFLFTDRSMSHISQRCCCKVQTSVVVLKILLQQMIMCCDFMISGHLHNESLECKWGKWRKLTCAKNLSLVCIVDGPLLHVSIYPSGLGSIHSWFL
jgi:hypothetical protein